MFLSRKLKIFGILTFVGVVLVTVSFVSPGWINVSEKKYMYDYIGISQEETEKSHSSYGLWYISQCYHYSPTEFMGPTEDRCKVSTYTDNPDPYIGVDVFLTLNNLWLLETRVLSSAGVFCAVLGFIGTIVFTRRMAKSRCAGLLTCISLSISGGTYIAAVVKTATFTYHNLSRGAIYFMPGSIKFLCPWALVLGGIGSLLILISAIGHLCILSRNKSDDGVQVYRIHKGTNQGIVSKHPYTTIAPPGYHAAVGLKVPLVDGMEKNEETGY